MLTETYIDALLVDEDLADQVWEWWSVGLINDELTALAWLRFLGVRHPLDGSHFRHKKGQRLPAFNVSIAQ